MAKPMFTLTTSASDGSPAVTVTGDVDLATVENFVALLTQATAQAPAITVDMRGVTFCDSSGVRALFAVAATTKLSLMVRAAGPMIKLLGISGLDRIATVTTWDQ